MNASMLRGVSRSSDPQDVFLQGISLYRKHTVRDGTCLFRVVAEQLYDLQMLHYEVRQECVRYMTLKRRIFEKQIEGDFDTYMRRMAKPLTMGTLVELRAMCLMYRRNVHFYEPCKLGVNMIFNTRFSDYLAVFYTSNNYFDSIYPMEHYERAAVAQTICYKLIYKKLFKLSDVELAVKKMLHSGRFKNFTNVQQDNRLINGNRRSFLLDQPENTCGNDSLSSDSISCIRQLLHTGCLPFSYKVAKSLDPHIYRNVDLDTWREMRREATIYIGDYNFQSGAKCRVELAAGQFDGYIQHIEARTSCCTVYVVGLGQKLLVSLAQVHLLPPPAFQPNRRKTRMPHNFYTNNDRSKGDFDVNCVGFVSWSKVRVTTALAPTSNLANCSQRQLPTTHKVGFHTRPQLMQPPMMPHMQIQQRQQQQQMSLVCYGIQHPNSAIRMQQPVHRGPF